MPVSVIVEMSYWKINEWRVNRLQLAIGRELSGHAIAHDVFDQMQKNEEKSSKHKVVLFDRSEGIFAVKTGIWGGGRCGHNRQTVTLHLESLIGECTCQKYQNTRILCSHAMAVAKSITMSPHSLVSPYFTEHAIRNSYDVALSPMQNEAYWPIYNGKLIIPPLQIDLDAN
ncbi:unnamed protein product [Linum trigynum]|uniref:SWIM-type domain-containing protein n=1 Tax=Linum trigynum TaxID=586398 RepID=A0AAV2EF21_9ROSI